MAHGKREIPRTIKQRLAIAAVALLLCCSVGGTLAWLSTATDPVENSFSPSEVKVTVDDDFENNVKSNIIVSVPDTLNVTSAYVRVALVATWEDASHAPVAKPANITLPTTLGAGWVLGADGFYYYTSPVEPGKDTTSLFGTATIEVPTDAQNNYHMNLQVLVDAVQSDGFMADGTTPAVADAWGPTVTGVNGGVLQVKTTKN